MMDGIAPTSKTAEHAFSAPIKVPINGEQVPLDLIRVQDLVDFTREVHDEQVRLVMENLDKIAGDDPKARFFAVSTVAGGDAAQATSQLKTPTAMAWMLNRCYSRTHPDEKRQLSQMLTIRQLIDVFDALSTSSGLTDPDPTSGGAKTEEKEEAGQT